VIIAIDSAAGLAKLDALPAGTEIVAYCRGACCVLARDAVRLLRASGRAVRHMGACTARTRVGDAGQGRAGSFSPPMLRERRPRRTSHA
jgi:hypothetical protein